MTLAAILTALGGKRIDSTSEAVFQRDVGRLLTAAGVAWEREVILSPRDRIDFLVGDIGIECKVQGSVGDVAQQLLRYAQHARIGALVLVTGRARLGRSLPAEFVFGRVAKPLRVVETWRGGL